MGLWLRLLLLAASAAAIAHGRHMMLVTSHAALSGVAQRPLAAQAQAQVQAQAHAQAPAQAQAQPQVQVQAKPRPQHGQPAVSVAVRTPSSVVQNWSLVCQQLCGAGLGGKPCTAECDAFEQMIEGRPPIKSSSSPHTKNMICKDLCTLQLGGTTCHCSSRPLANERDLNLACSTFCDNNNARLAGCSPCEKRQMLSEPIEMPSNQPKDWMAERDDAATSTTQMATTTPNWNELCASLCKTGDGGSLCNCDLSPFFF